MAFDVGAISFRDAKLTITEPETIINRIYQANKDDGFSDREAMLATMVSYNAIKETVYKNALDIVNQYEQF
ncbi:hypothetical protein ACJJVG_08835 [Pseudocitrobacter faecalis]|uniref:hypothetical protein n=1 Tax=Pseudocitrobacter faecalis TaxID=1398493 RepID=UPI0038998CDF